MVNPKKILYIHGITDLAGGEFFLLNLQKHLPQDKYATYFILPNEGALTKRLRQVCPQVHIFAFQGKSFFRKWAAFFKSVGQLVLFVKKHQIQLIHANDYKPALMACLAAKIWGIPLIWTIHGPAYNLQNPLKKKLLSFCLKRLISVSHFSAQRLAAYPESKLEIIPIGIDTDKFQPSTGKTRSPKQPLTITNIGRFDRIKRLETTILAMHVLKQTNLDFRLLLVANDFHNQPEDYHQEILDLIQAKQLQDSIKIMPFTDPIQNIYEQTDILISTSSFETLGLTIMEAMACGIPVISTRSGGPEETILDGQTGYLIETDDHQALADKINQLASKPDLARQLGECGRQRILANYSIQSMVEEYDKLYTSLFAEQ
ncbi:MAG TPA: glycosyltransferase family 1 protein [Candidatus Wirthbacteria bacterium]|nr:glycosyltransferase family 1 protein [Candidatus Wirthbacteria bacterium]